MAFKTVVIGNGRGDLSLNSMDGLSKGDIVAIKPGIYSSGSFSNIDGLTFINNGGTVTFTGPLIIRNLSNIEFSGTGSPGLLYGFVFTDNGGFVVRGHCEQFRVYYALLKSNIHLLDVTQTGLVYDGKRETIALLNTTIANVHMDHCFELVVGGFQVCTNFQNVIDSIDVHNLRVDSSRGADKIVSGSGIYRCHFYDWTVNNDNVYPNLDCGLIFISGNGSFHHIYQRGGWGNLVRCFGVSLGHTVQEVWIYNNIRLNTLKYGLANVEIHQEELTENGPGITGVNIHVVNNTEGNCIDYNGGWFTPIFLTPALVRGYTVEIKNNIGFNMPSFHQMVVNFTGVPITDTAANRYYATAEAAGLEDDINCLPVIGSPLIDAGVTVPYVKDDFKHVARPQRRGYDIGARENNQPRGTASGRNFSWPIFNPVLCACFLPLMNIRRFSISFN